MNIFVKLVIWYQNTKQMCVHVNAYVYIHMWSEHDKYMQTEFYKIGFIYMHGFSGLFHSSGVNS
jgi:hypothetical protein